MFKHPRREDGPSIISVMKWIPDQSVSIKKSFSVQGYLAHTTPPHQDPTVGLCPGPYGGLNRVTH